MRLRWPEKHYYLWYNVPCFVLGLPSQFPYKAKDRKIDPTTANVEAFVRISKHDLTMFELCCALFSVVSFAFVSNSKGIARTFASQALEVQPQVLYEDSG